MADFDRYLAACEDRWARYFFDRDESEDEATRQADREAAVWNNPAARDAHNRIMAGLPPVDGAVYDDEGRMVFLDEYGRHPDHPDHGYPGPSIDTCPHCQWTGDALADGYHCPKCGTLTERED